MKNSGEKILGRSHAVRSLPEDSDFFLNDSLYYPYILLVYMPMALFSIALHPVRYYSTVVSESGVSVGSDFNRLNLRQSSVRLPYVLK